MDVIKSRLDRGFYKRLDTFQRDMFLCFERARKLSRTDSQLFEDSIELQSFFIRSRDEVCKNGSVLKSTALFYAVTDLMTSVESLREEKRSKELPQDEDVGISEAEPKKEEEALVFQTYQVRQYTTDIPNCYWKGYVLLRTNQTVVTLKLFTLNYEVK